MSEQLEFRRAIRDALAEELERDERVVFFGEDVAAPGGVFAVTPGLQDRFGPDRVFDTPISELALATALSICSSIRRSSSAISASSIPSASRRSRARGSGSRASQCSTSAFGRYFAGSAFEWP